MLIVRGASHLLEDVEAQSDLRARAHAVRRYRTQERSDPAAGTGERGRRRAHLHRLGEPAVQPVGLLDRGRALCRREGQGGGRDRRAWARRASIMPASFRWWITRRRSWAACWPRPGFAYIKECHVSGEDDEHHARKQAANADARGASRRDRRRCKAEIAELKDRLLRALADAENTRRRAEREKQERRQYAVTRFARDMLAVADNFARAIGAPAGRGARPPSAQVKAVIEGVEATERQLLATLERHGIKRIETAGAKIRSQSASGHRRSAGRGPGARHHRERRPDRLRHRRPAAQARHGDGGQGGRRRGPRNAMARLAADISTPSV